jgi:DNA processing protein
MDEQELRAWLQLVRHARLNADAVAELFASFDSPVDIVNATVDSLIAAGLRPAAAARLKQPNDAALDGDLTWTQKSGNHFLRYIDPAYPRMLLHLRSPPAGVFVRGQVASLALPQLAIVGARNPTASGRETAEEFATHLAACGLAITSGLAAGIDGAAHRGALRAGGITIAVCGTGLDTVYPNDHRELAAKICERGALLSEFPPGTPLLRRNFPRRNRLISGLSLGTLVVEAALRSGSLITARFAADQGREVFAIPGSIHNPLSRGCHRLLRQGAKLVETAADILDELGPLAAACRGALTLADSRGTPLTTCRFPQPPLDKDYKMLLDALGFEPSSVDQLVGRSGLKAEEVASMLLILELDGRVEAGVGAMYLRTAAGAP